MDTIQIIVRGEKLSPKQFFVNQNSTIHIVKKLIVARISFKGRYLKPAWDKCLLMKNGIVLEDSSIVKNCIQNNDELFIQVYLYYRDKLVTIEEVIQNNQLEFAKANPTKLDYLNKHFGKVDNVLSSFSNVIGFNNNMFNYANQNNRGHDEGGFYYKWD